MKIGGRFEFDPESGEVQVWFSTGGHRVFDAGADAYDLLKAFRGEVPIRLTGGRATQKDPRTWREQLDGKEADRWLKANAKAAKPVVGQLSDEEFSKLMEGIL